MKKTNEKGITLVALIVTIIVLLILAGVSMAMLTGENGILTQAQNAKEETERAQEKEEALLEELENKITGNSYLTSKGINAPVLKDNMELVTYDEETGEWKENNSSEAYDYVAGTGTEDNNKSKWANARVTVDGVDSYFVWIPRYAYKITYNNPENKSEGGTIDVKFLVGTSDNYYDENGELKEAKRAVTGHEDTTSDYYVHPVFTNNVDLGGWDSELTGIWIGKYETSLVDKESKENIITTETGDTAGDILLSENTDKAIAVQPGLSSWRYCTIGNMYTNAKGYAKNLNSHMLKNSEWGAVAYLTHSQYGRNGTRITINDNANFITADENINANTEQSTTGNVTGIYDLSGGAYEYVAAYYSESTSNNLTNNGSSLVEDWKNTATKKYAMIYTDTNTSLAYKLGDATAETEKWHNNANVFITSFSPFFLRGGYSFFDVDAGVFFFANYDGGYGRECFSFRMCLAVK